MENCTSNFTGLTEIEKKDTIPMTIQANENYIFNENGYYILYTDSGQEIEKHILTEKGSNKIEFNLEITNQTKKVSIYMVAEKEKDTTNVSTNIYLTNENELNELSLKRFNTSSQAPIDNYSEYITNLFKIPFDVSNNIGNSSNIIIANINTNVQSTKIINSLLKVDLGSIEIKGINNNKLDYYNINPYIYLPFLEKQSLSIDDIMNQTIKVNYLINLYDGKCTINVYNNSNIILSVNKQIGGKIPFLKDNKTYSNNGDILINKLEKWYIIIDYNKPIETMFGYDVNFESILNNLHGYSEIKNVKLKSNASQNEQLEIKQQISQGVILP